MYLGNSSPFFSALLRPPYLQFIDIGVEDAIHEADTRRLVRVLVGQLDVDLPNAAFERGCIFSDRQVSNRRRFTGRGRSSGEGTVGDDKLSAGPLNRT